MSNFCGWRFASFTGFYSKYLTELWHVDQKEKYFEIHVMFVVMKNLNRLFRKLIIFR